MTDKWKKFSTDQEAQDASDIPDSSDGAASLDVSEAPESLKINFPERDELEQKLAELQDKNLRLVAQLKNTQERAERDVSNAHKYGSEKLISDLLPIIDSLTRGLDTVKIEETDEPLAKGMKLTLDLLENTLKKYGVTVISPAPGERFNPEQHEAMAMQPAGPGMEPNSVIQTVQAGYSLNGRVLRAAMVIVGS
jgi:molecular chaperone GrpE